MDDLTTYLTTIVRNDTFPLTTRAFAEQVLMQWNRNVIPDPNVLKKLSKLIQPPPPCSKSDAQGNCAWLRKYGDRYNLQVSPLGEKATCCFRSSNSKCPGYKKLR